VLNLRDLEEFMCCYSVSEGSLHGHEILTNFYFFIFYIAHFRCFRWSIQGDSEGKVSILADNRICYCEKEVHINMCSILDGYRDRAVWIYK